MLGHGQWQFTALRSREKRTNRSFVITENHGTSAFLHRRIIIGEFIFWNVVLQTADIPEGKESMQMVTKLHSSTLPARQILAMLFARWDGRRGGEGPPTLEF